MNNSRVVSKGLFSEMNKNNKKVIQSVKWAERSISNQMNQQCLLQKYKGFPQRI